MDKRNPSDGSLNSSQLTLSMDVSTADTLGIQVVDDSGNSVAGIHAILITGDTVDEDLFTGGTFAIAATGLNSLLAAEDATQPDTILAITDINGAYVSDGTMATGVTVRATLVGSGVTKEATLT